MTTETKIKRALTRLQKLVHQYYDENPGTVDSGINKPNSKDIINYYGSAIVGIVYNEYTDKWQTIANITINGKGDRHIDIRSPIDYKPVK
jgi:hypothetical protein